MTKWFLGFFLQFYQSRLLRIPFFFFSKENRINGQHERKLPNEKRKWSYLPHHSPITFRTFCIVHVNACIAVKWQKGDNNNQKQEGLSKYNYRNEWKMVLNVNLPKRLHSKKKGIIMHKISRRPFLAFALIQHIQTPHKLHLLCESVLFAKSTSTKG